MIHKSRVRLSHPMVLLGPAALLLVLYAFARVYFYWVNRSAFHGVDFSDLCEAFFLGLRFDASFLILWNGIFILICFFPWDWLGRFQKSLAWTELSLFAFLNLPPLWSNLIDAEYFPFSGRRSTRAVFAMLDDMKGEVGAEALHYWHIPVLMSLSGLLFFVFLLFWRRRNDNKARRFSLGMVSYPFLLVSLIFMGVLGVRGGFQTKPLGPWHAFQLPSTSLGALSLNTPFSLLRTQSRQALPKVSYFNSDSEAGRILRGDATGKSHFQPRKSNVIVFVLESFALEFFGEKLSSPSYMPFLKSLEAKGLSFDYAFANGRSSIVALPSVLAGVPTLMDEPYVTSVYNGSRVNGLGSILRERGYASHFFHGGRNGSMYFDTVARLSGFENFYGLNEYPNRNDFDGTWGVFDEPMYRWAVSLLSKETKPFVAGFFSLSSHSPYRIPAQYQGRFPKGGHPIVESLGYADNALKVFFEEAQKEPWFRDTIFVFTADHAIDGTDPRYLNEVGRFRVPMIFYDTAHRLPTGRWPVVVQQADIVPSVLDALGIDPASVPLPPFGFSVFDPKAPRRAAVYLPGAVVLVKKDAVALGGALSGSDDAEPRVMPAAHDVLSIGSGKVSDQKTESLSREWKALVQFYHNALNRNSLLEK
jgi:phosphoglycerol transferase MdoB-like AlkP superfamily enzyme